MIFEIEIPELFSSLSGIYIIKNNINDKVYIGRAKNLLRRAIQHKRKFEKLEENRKLNTFIKENPNVKFELSVLEYTNNIKEEEEKLIKKYNSVEKGFNIIYNDEEFLEMKWSRKKRRKKKNKKTPYIKPSEKIRQMIFGKERKSTRKKDWKPVDLSFITKK